MSLSPQIEAARAKQRRGMELTDEEFDLLNSFWKSDYASPEFLSRVRTHRMGDYPESPIDKDFFNTESIQKPGAIYCTFCHKETAHHEATYGSIPKKPLKVEDWDYSQDPPALLVKWIHSSNKVVACPDCCLRVTPVVEKVDKDDPESPTRYVKHTIKFQDYD